MQATAIVAHSSSGSRYDLSLRFHRHALPDSRFADLPRGLSIRQIFHGHCFERGGGGGA